MLFDIVLLFDCHCMWSRRQMAAAEPSGRRPRGNSFRQSDAKDRGIEVRHDEGKLVHIGRRAYKLGALPREKISDAALREMASIVVRSAHRAGIFRIASSIARQYLSALTRPGVCGLCYQPSPPLDGAA